MAKPKSKRKTATRPAVRKTGRPAASKRPTTASAPPAARSSTKHDRVIALLRTPAGATLASLVTATGWQPHSVRGFLAGVVRKKLGLNLVSRIGDKGRAYRVNDGKASPVALDRSKQVS
jgi:hypothetical protein